MELEHHRKDAKQLLRGFRAGEPEARRRAFEALGERAQERFQLGDAQHVVALEHGYRSWPQLKHAPQHAEPDRPVERIGLQPVSFYEERARELIAAAVLLAEDAIWPLALWSAAGLGRLDLMETMVDGNGNLLPPAGGHRPNLADIGWPPAPPPDNDRQTTLDEALTYAAISGRNAAVDWLLDRGADVNGRPYQNVTPLHFAVQFGRASTVQLLLARGADPEIRDDIRGGTPLGWATYQGRDEIARLLDPGRRETITDTGLAYRPGEPVRLRVRRRERRLTVSDDGGAIAQAGRPAGWRAVAERLERELDVNISGTGAVWLPVVAVGPPHDAVEERIAQASLTFYQELLELAGE
jgi:Ankyrin repeats (many copies)